MSFGAIFLEAAKEVAKEVADKTLEIAAEAGKEATFELPKRFGEEAAAEYLGGTDEEKNISIDEIEVGR